MNLIDKVVGSNFTFSRKDLIDFWAGQYPFTIDGNIEILKEIMVDSYIHLQHFLKMQLLVIESTNVYPETTYQIGLIYRMLYDMLSNGKEKARVSNREKKILKTIGNSIVIGNQYGLSRYLVTALLVGQMKQIILYLQDDKEEEVSYGITATGLFYINGFELSAYRWEDVLSYSLLSTGLGTEHERVDLILELNDGVTFEQNVKVILNNQLLTDVLAPIFQSLNIRNFFYDYSYPLATKLNR